MWLPIAFIGVPLIEIGLFIQVGGWLGLWPTLLIVVLTAILGTILVRSQGLAALQNIQNSLDRMDNPTGPLAHAAMILLSGALLLTPGFFTDAVGFALLMPRVREAVFSFLRKRMRVQSFTVNTAGTTYRTSDRQGDVVEGTFQEVDPDSVEPKPTSQPSAWTRD